MRLIFSNDPSTGCECSLGEYLQELRGFSERTNPGGTPRQDRVPLVGGLIDPSDFREDARERNPNLPYGHRDIGEREGDEFSPYRETGCFYNGSDEPGMTGTTPGQRMRFHFEFRGAPVDRRNRSTLLWPWQYWSVEGDYTIPQPPSPPPGPTTSTPRPPPPMPGPQAQPSPAASPYQGPTIGPAPRPATPLVFCLGGRIGCETLEFLQQQLREHTFLTRRDVNEAVDIEHRLLLRTRQRPPFVDIHQAEDYQAWVLRLRQEARQRIRDFARDHFMPFPD